MYVHAPYSRQALCPFRLDAPPIGMHFSSKKGLQGNHSMRRQLTF
jgi:hypothetical protein